MTASSLITAVAVGLVLGVLAWWLVPASRRASIADQPVRRGPKAVGGIPRCLFTLACGDLAPRLIDRALGPTVASGLDARSVTSSARSRVSAVLYKDGRVMLDAEGVTLRRYSFPGGRPKRIPYREIKDVRVPRMGWLTGKGQGWKPPAGRPSRSVTSCPGAPTTSWPSARSSAP